MRNENLVRFGAVSVALAMAAGAFMVGCSDDASGGGSTPATDSGAPVVDGSTPVADSSTPAGDAASNPDAARADSGPADAGPAPVTKLHVVHAAAGVGPVSLCLGGSVGSATAAPSVWPDVAGGALSGGKGSAPLPQAFGTSLTIPGSVVSAAAAATVVVFAFPLTQAQFAANLPGGSGDKGAVGADCATLYTNRATNGGVELGRIPAGTITAGTAFVAAAVDVAGVDGGAATVGLKVTKMDSAAPAAGQVGVHFLHHALKTVNPQTGAQLTVAVGALSPATGDAGTCPFTFNKVQAAAFPDKAAAKADVATAVFSGPGADGGVEGRYLAIGVDTSAGVAPITTPSQTTPCGYALFPFDAVATLSSGGVQTPAATYFTAGKTYSFIAIGDVTKGPQQPTVTTDAGTAPNPAFFTNWFRVLAFANN